MTLTSHPLRKPGLCRAFVRASTSLAQKADSPFVGCAGRVHDQGRIFN
jgi:hypothetical protein